MDFFSVGVRVGEYNISSTDDCEVEETGEETCAPPVQDVGIETFITHPRYNASIYTEDIGLIRLSSPLNMSVGKSKMY